MFREDCSFTGKEVFKKIRVVNAHECQHLLLLLGPSYGGVYFYYERETQVCTFYDSMAAVCHSFSGPDFPDVDECRCDCVYCSR